MTNTNPKWVTVKQLPAIYPSFSEPGVRWIIFNSANNGFNSCIRKIGRKILINIEEFERWVESHKS